MIRTSAAPGRVDGRRRTGGRGGGGPGRDRAGSGNACSCVRWCSAGAPTGLILRGKCVRAIRPGKVRLTQSFALLFLILTQSLPIVNLFFGQDFRHSFAFVAKMPKTGDFSWKNALNRSKRIDCTINEFGAVPQAFPADLPQLPGGRRRAGAAERGVAGTGRGVFDQNAPADPGLDRSKRINHNKMIKNCQKIVQKDLYFWKKPCMITTSRGANVCDPDAFFHSEGGPICKVYGLRSFWR